MTVFKTKKYSFEAVRFDGTNQDEIKEFGGDNVHVWPDGTVYIMCEHSLIWQSHAYSEFERLCEGEYVCKDEDGIFGTSSDIIERSRLIEPAITFHANEEGEDEES